MTVHSNQEHQNALLRDMEILMEENPDFVRRRSAMGYPLHEACIRGVPLIFVQTLVERFPEAVTANVTDECCQTPLFLACWCSEPKMETIAYLVQADYPGCLVGTSERPPLLHWCMSIWHQSRPVWTMLMDWVLSTYPQAADMPDFQGRYLVHHATSTRDADRFRQLLDTYRDTLVDAHGNHLLHVAVTEDDCFPQNLDCILEHCPDAVFCMNHQGELPLHVAIRWQDRQLLADKHPFGLLQITRDGSTCIGNIRRELEQWFQVYYPQMGEAIDVDEYHTHTGEDVKRRDEDDWEMPCVMWPSQSRRPFLRELNRIFHVLKIQVIQPLQDSLNESIQQSIHCEIPADVLSQILSFAVPHYDETLLHSPYLDDSGEDW